MNATSALSLVKVLELIRRFPTTEMRKSILMVHAKQIVHPQRMTSVVKNNL